MKRFTLLPGRNVALVWCGVMPRRGGRVNAGTHMRTCQDCRRVRERFWGDAVGPRYGPHGDRVPRKDAP